MTPEERKARRAARKEYQEPPSQPGISPKAWIIAGAVFAVIFTIELVLLVQYFS